MRSRSPGQRGGSELEFRGPATGEACRSAPDRSSTLCRAALLFLPVCAFAQTLPLPARAPDAPTGSEFMRRLTLLDFTNREQEILSQVRAGNVPDFLRKL